MDLAQTIEKGLTGAAPVFLDVTAFARVGFGQEVYPSQEMILDQGGAKKGKKSKTLYSVDQAAAMHSRRSATPCAPSTLVSGADDDETGIGPIAVEPYGSVTSRGTAIASRKRKFLHVAGQLGAQGQGPGGGTTTLRHGTLIRGGACSSKKQDKP